MTELAIQVEGLGKRYRIGRRRRTGTLREAITEAISAPFRRIRDPRLSAGNDTFWALKDVSFDVKRGEVLGIIGRNGAGKSTLLKVLARITEPTEGEARIYGRVGSLLEVGTGFHPELTGRENIFLNGAILGMKRGEIARKFDEIVAFSEVEKFIDTPVKHYSSGMYVRLAFAVAAHLESEILVVDEVLAVGDAEFQKKCLGKMSEAAHGGRTVLFVSHQLGTVRELCGRGILMDAGKATVFDSIDSALRRYLRPPESLDAPHCRMKHIVDVSGGEERAREFHLFFGEPLVIRAKLRELPGPPIGVTVGIKDSWGKRLSLFSTNPHDGVTLPRKAMEIAFRMDFCAYAPGEYYVDVAVTEPHIRIIEEAANVLRFEILPAPRGGSLAYTPAYGEFFPQHAWEFE
jgi:lipopolysaccharide transport system ATP-binding protein